jgi:uncharacterized protein (TIGR02757 family)
MTNAGFNKTKAFLDAKVKEYNVPAFIASDPVCIPHLFQLQQDREIAGLFAAIFAWGNRTTIINKTKELMERMDDSPYHFCRELKPASLKQLEGFKHRTFTADDLFYFIDFLHRHYQQQDSLETAFFPRKGMTVEEGLNHFRNYFFAADHLKRTEKHIASPEQGSTCKRLNMFLRWMVRRDNKGVDFGYWKNCSPAALICPLDLHVARVARKLGLIRRTQTDWQTALELTDILKKMDPKDPVKYDFALFNLGIVEKL